MGKDVIIACDFSGREAALSFLDRFDGMDRKPFVKIGMELFYGAGPDIVRKIKGRGHKIFLDLKLHDIPNTVKKAMSVLNRLDVDICNLHAAGTIRMMEAAIEGLIRPDVTAVINGREIFLDERTIGCLDWAELDYANLTVVPLVLHSDCSNNDYKQLYLKNMTEYLKDTYH